MHFLFTLNEAYAPHLAATLVSILHSQSVDQELVFHVIHSDITPDTEQKLVSLKSVRPFEIKFYKACEVGLDLSDFKITMPHISLETYYRLFAQDVLTGLDKVIHLDVDLLVLRDVSLLWSLPIDDYYMTGTRCPVVHADYLNPIGCNFDKNPYYQAGVNVLNLKKMRENHIGRKVHEIVQKFMPLLKRQDQDILNIIAEGRVLETPISYNFATVFLYDREVRRRLKSNQDYIEAVKRPHVVHFSRSVKPWHDVSRHPYKHLYWDFLKQTPWKDQSPRHYPLLRLVKQELSPVMFNCAKAAYQKLVPGLIKKNIDQLYYKALIWKLGKNNQNQYQGLKMGESVYSVIKDSQPAFLYFYKMTGLKPVSHPKDCDAVILWGTKFFGRHFLVFLSAVYYRKPLVMAEDAFVRSLDISERKEPGLSCILDHMGLYYDYHQGSNIDRLLNSDWTMDEAQENESSHCMALLLNHSVSKYNLVPPTDINFKGDGRYKNIVLVIDQRKGDQSVKGAGADESSFQRMLSDALRENPESLILIKTHPDEKHGGFKGYFSQYVPDNSNVRILDETLNPISLLKSVDKVYVVSSQMGMEALICGKDVTCYGAPFYSGWGLTTDRGPRRERLMKRSLGELFYAAYIRFAYYYDPENSVPCRLEALIDYLAKKMRNAQD